MGNKKNYMVLANKYIKKYGSLRQFDSLDEAADYALDRLEDEPMLLRRLPATGADYGLAKDSEKPYVFVKYSKGRDTDWGGYTVAWNEYSIQKCDKESLERTLQKVSKNASTVHLGLELKLSDFITKKVNALTEQVEE